jgi:hypothetical protein
MKLSRRFTDLFRGPHAAPEPLGDPQPWAGEPTDIDRRISEWTELIEGGVPPASLEASASSRNDNHSE